MYVFFLLLIFFIIAALLGIIEYYRHQKRIYSIPIRIHINGTRGKSSVTRLIGAGLNAGGIRTITKVTGTYPRLILEDGTETAVYRKANANIIEQLNIVKFASDRKAGALVIECMALEPQYQWITENQMIHATLGVITNVRLDHVDVMGHTLPEIASVLGRTIPQDQHLFTAELDNPHLLKLIADKKNSIMHLADPSVISDYEMQGFSYIEHKENVALALAVCEHFGIKRAVAFTGMYKANPDAGALLCNNIYAEDKKMIFFNAFAANDPQSTLMIWKKLLNENLLEGKKIALLNTRQDRLDRARQLSEMMGKEINDADYLILIGQTTEVVEHMCVSYGFPKRKIINLGWTDPQVVIDSILSVTDDVSTVVAIGNIGGMGAIVVSEIENRSLVND
jgi:gamma-polyglutamate synthase